jgi:dienelactone hydrolase
MSGSPDGQYALVHRCRPIASRPTDGIERWPTYAEVWDLASPDAHIVYRESDPSNGAGDSEYGLFGRWHWHPLEPATLVRAQEYDDGHCIARLSAPFHSGQNPLYTTTGSISRFGWARTGELVVRQCEADGSRVFLSVGDRHHAGPPVAVGEQRPEDLQWPLGSWRIGELEWNREARPIWAGNNGHDGILLSSGDGVYVEQYPSDGSNSTLLRAVSGRHEEEIYRSTGEEFERVVGALGKDHPWLLLAVENPTIPATLVLRHRWTGLRHDFDRMRRTAGVSAGVVRRLLCTETVGDIRIFLPGQPAGPLPLLLWISPNLGAGDEQSAVRNRYQSNRYLELVGMSALRLALEGAAVAMCPAIQMDPLDAGEAFMRRLVDRVHTVADELVSSGIADTERLSLGGHCAGAYATVLVLGHSQRFKAGIASGGKYNLAATPLGSLLTAHRRLWETPEIYLERSPIGLAARIRTPLLLVHGEHDRRVPWSASYELFQAIAFAGGTCRFVCLPHEDHFFQSVEGTATFVGEMAQWIHRHTSNQG